MCGYVLELSHESNPFFASDTVNIQRAFKIASYELFSLKTCAKGRSYISWMVLALKKEKAKEGVHVGQRER